jgi:hypothetical protein
MAKIKPTIQATPTPTKETKPDVKPLDAFKDKIASPVNEPEIGADGIKHKNRRTREQLIADGYYSGKKTAGAVIETLQDETGFEVLADLLKSQADSDTKKFGLPICDRETFEPFAKNVMKLSNYFLGRYAKPWHMLAGVTAFQAYILIQTRSGLIDKYSPKVKKPEAVKTENVPATPDKPVAFTLTPQENRSEAQLKTFS